MSHDPRLRFLFAAYMAGGNGTILQNLEEVVGKRADLDSDWLRIEMDAESEILGRPPHRSLIPGTIRNSMVTGERIGRLERGRASFDAAYFFQHTICMFLWRFRSRVPYLMAMDGTPDWYNRNELWYTQAPFDPGSATARIKHELVRRVYASADHLLPLSWSCRDSLIQDYGIPPERITVVPPGINLDRYACPDRRATPPHRPFRVLFVGADFVRKGGDLLVELAGRPAFRDVEFDLVTKSYQGPAAANVRVHDRMTTNSAPLVQLFREADLFVLPTRADSHAIASLEAMAVGLPVVTTLVGGVGDVVQDGVTGFLVPRGDVETLAARIQQLRQDRELRIHMGLAGRRRVESQFNGTTIAATVVDLLTRAAKCRANRR